MKKKILALTLTIVMLLAMMPFAQTTVFAEETKTFNDLIGNSINNGITSSFKSISFDTASEFATFNSFNSSTMSTANDVLTLPATEAETAVNKSFRGFPVGSVLHYKIDGFIGSNTKNDTSKPGVILYYDNAYVLMLPFNDVGGKPSLRGSTDNGWKGLTDGKIDTTKPFEIIVKRKGTVKHDVWAKQTDVTGDNYIKLATINASSSANGNSIWLKSGNNQGIKFDYVKTYYSDESSIVSTLKSSMQSGNYNTVNNYRGACGITDETWTEFNSLSDKSAVYEAINTDSVTTLMDFGSAFTQAVMSEQEIIPPVEQQVWDFEDEAEIENWTNEVSNVWKIQNGVLKSNVNNSNKESVLNYNAKRNIDYADDFVFEAKMRYNTINGMFAVLFNMSDSHIMIKKERDLWRTNAEGGNLYDQATNVERNEWFTLKVETYNNAKRARWYIDDNLVRDFEIVKDNIYLDELILVQNTVTNHVLDSEVEIDYMKFDLIDNRINISGINSGDVLSEGEDIELTAAFEQKINADKVEYLINDVVAAEGVAPDYRVTISDLPAGIYELKARAGEEKSAAVDFKVNAAFYGNVAVQKNSSNGITLTTNLTDNLNQVAEIEYLVDGVPAGSSENKSLFPVDIPKFSNAQHTITAICKNANGIVIGKISDSVMPDLTGGAVSENYSNEISYTVSGTKGNAIYEYNNGSHKLYLKHTNNELVYLADKGETTYKLGTGKFTILTNGPYADVFRNGQFAFSFVLPRTSAVSKNIAEKGLTIDNEKVSVPENRRNYFVKENISAEQSTYDVPELPYVYNMDFTADKDDDVRFIVNDGYYRVDMSIREGKIYAWNCLKNRTAPSEKLLCDFPDADGDVYFRLETSSGMSRLYADGKWIATFRDARTAGGRNISIKASNGSELDFVSLRDATDVYVYSTSFDNSGEYPSKHYWKSSDSFYIDKNKGILLDASDAEEARAELNAFAGDMEFAADVTLEELQGGFWFMADHCVTDVYSKIGYNAKSGRFEAFDYINGTTSNMHTANGSLPVNRKFNIKLVARQYNDKKEMILYVDGTPVLTYTKTRFMRGTIGFVIADGVGYINSVDYRGDTRPTKAGTVFVHSQHISVPTHDVLENGDKITLVSSEHGRFVSEDQGKTWTLAPRVENDNHEILQFRDENGNVTNEAICLNTEATGMVDKDGMSLNNVALYRSFDYGETWTFERYINAEPEVTIGILYGRLQQGLSEKIYVPVYGGANENEGFVYIYYSNDKGKTWSRSNKLDSNELGYLVQEPCIVEMADGTVRMYSRNNTGYINYFVSEDGGKTFEPTPYDTPFINAANCFNIQRDPYDPETIYMFWEYDNPNLNPTEQFPRTRWVLARSTDECETWEFLGTIHENITPTVNESQNPTMSITKDLIIMDCWSDDTYDPVGQPGRIITVRKDRLQGTKDFERVHLVGNDVIENTATIIKSFRDDMLIIHTQNGNVLSHGEMYTGMAQNGYVSADIAADYIKARTIYEDDGAVTLKVGTTNVTFSGSSVMEKGGKRFILISEFAQKFDLKTTIDGSVTIISTDDKWSDIQKKTARNAVDLFSVESRNTFEDLIGDAIDKGLATNKLTLDTAEEFATLGGFNSSAMSTTDGIFTTPTDDYDLTHKTDGFPVGSVMHFKVDGFVGTNANTSDRPAINFYWLDSTSPKKGYYFVLKFRDVDGKPALHYGASSIQSESIDTSAPFEVLVKRTSTTGVEIYARQSESADPGYIKIAEKNVSRVDYMNQICIAAGNKQSVKIDYIKVYENNESTVINTLKASLNASGYTNIEQYIDICGVTAETWRDFKALADKTTVYGIDTDSITTAEDFGAAFTEAVAGQKAVEIGSLSSFDKLIGFDIYKKLASKKLSLDTEAEFSAAFPSNDVTGGILTTPTTEGNLTLNNKVNGFPVGSALHFKVDGIVGTNSNTSDRPGITLYWLDSSSPKVGYYFMLKFKDINGKPALHYAGSSIQSAFIDTSIPFEVFVKRIATEQVEIYARQSDSASEGYIKLATKSISRVDHMNQISIMTDNGQSVKFDYINVYQNSESSIINSVNTYINGSDYENALVSINYYQNAFGISKDAMTNYNALKYPDMVFDALKPAAFKSCEEIGAAFTSAVSNQKSFEEDSLTTFDELIGSGITRGIVSNKLTLDTEAELKAVFSTSNVTNGILTMPTTNTELALNRKTDGFPLGSALHVKVDGFTGTNSNEGDRPGIVMYWLDSSSVGYYFMLKFKDIDGKPVLHFADTPIASGFLDTSVPFEVVAKRTATKEIEIYIKQSESQDDLYIKVASGAPVAVTHMNQIAIRSGNGQSIKFDYIKFYQNNEPAIVGDLSSSISNNNYTNATTNIKYYKTQYGISQDTLVAFNGLKYPDRVYDMMKKSTYTTCEEAGALFTKTVVARKAHEAKSVGTIAAIPSLVKSGNGFAASVGFEDYRTTDVTKNAIVIVALYGENNKLLYPPTMGTVSVTAGYSDVFELSGIESGDDVKYAKLFVWEKTTSETADLIPLGEFVQCFD